MSASKTKRKLPPETQPVSPAADVNPIFKFHDRTIKSLCTPDVLERAQSLARVAVDGVVLFDDKAGQINAAVFEQNVTIKLGQGQGEGAPAAVEDTTCTCKFADLLKYLLFRLCVVFSVRVSTNASIQVRACGRIAVRAAVRRREGHRQAQCDRAARGRGRGPPAQPHRRLGAAEHDLLSVTLLSAFVCAVMCACVRAHFVGCVRRLLCAGIEKHKAGVAHVQQDEADAPAAKRARHTHTHTDTDRETDADTDAHMHTHSHSKTKTAVKSDRDRDRDKAGDAEQDKHKIKTKGSKQESEQENKGERKGETQTQTQPHKKPAQNQVTLTHFVR